MPIRTILADDHQIVLDALSALLENEQDIKVVGIATDGQSVLKLVSSLEPDVVVMDVDMPGMNGIEATRQMITKHPGTKIIALSAHSQKQQILGMLNAGASAYIIKENSRNELLRALRAVVQGQKYLCAEVAAAVIDSSGNHHEDGMPQLGRREREILQLLAEGGSSPEIAKRLFISKSTVDVHRRNIMKKLDLHCVADLTKYAVRNGLTSR